MSETDNPLKLLITEFAPTFASWLMGVSVSSARPINAEFPGRPLRSDLLFEVLTEQGQKHLLHVEFQGRRTRQWMPYRELEYMTQTAVREIPLPIVSGTPRLHSVVLYVGEGAGREDNGRYTIQGMGNDISLHWQYQVIRLWEMPATALLQSQQPALAALIGQTRLQQPEVGLPHALRAIRSVADEVARQQLLTALVALLPTKEVTQMGESLLEESETLLIDTPYLRRMRELGWQEGMQIGRQEGILAGRQEGMQIGRQEGMQIGRQEGVQSVRRVILDVVARKLTPSLTDYLQLQHNLEQIYQPEALEQVLLTVVNAAEIGVVLQVVRETAVNTPHP